MATSALPVNVWDNIVDQWRSRMWDVSDKFPHILYHIYFSFYLILSAFRSLHAQQSYNTLNLRSIRKLAARTKFLLIYIKFGI